jgi:hypothetical protein
MKLCTSSSTIDTPCAEATAATSRRRSSGITVPSGFWMVGIV